MPIDPVNPQLDVWAQRARLHDRAHDVARKLVARFSSQLPDDVRTVAAYWQACLLSADRAASQLIAYATIFGIHPEARSTPSSTELGPWPR